ncbi:Lipoprotein signal peptidase [Alphaproteobacteria bacterium]
MLKLFSKIGIIALLTAIIDQLTKFWVLEFLQSHQTSQYIVTASFNLVEVYNYGISFGICNSPEHSKWLFIAISSIIIMSLLFLYANTTPTYRMITPLGLIIGGATGNILDRFLRNAVLDFIDLHFLHHHYPAFNYADSMIVFGSISILILELFKNIKKIPYTKSYF